MGKASVRVIQVPRAATAAMLVVLSIAMALVIFALSGRAYQRDRMSMAQVVSLVRRYDRGGLTNDALLASVAPAIADVCFFIPWGALAFLSFDAERHRVRSYLLTLIVGVTFAFGLVAWQSALPTRVTGWDDAGWNGVGCLAGAVGGHLRKRVRVRFD